MKFFHKEIWRMKNLTNYFLRLLFRFQWVNLRYLLLILLLLLLLFLLLLPPLFFLILPSYHPLFSPFFTLQHCVLLNFWGRSNKNFKVTGKYNFIQVTVLFIKTICYEFVYVLYFTFVRYCPIRPFSLRCIDILLYPIKLLSTRFNSTRLTGNVGWCPIPHILHGSCATLQSLHWTRKQSRVEFLLCWWWMKNPVWSSAKDMKDEIG